MLTSSSPTCRRSASATGRELMRQTLRPSAENSRCRMTESSSGVMPCAARASCTVGESAANTPVTQAREVPVRTRSRLALPPSSAPRESMMIDLPAPVSPVSTFMPGRNWMSADSMTATFSIWRSSSIPITPYSSSLPASSLKASAAGLLVMTQKTVSSPAREPTTSGLRMASMA